MIRRDPVTAAYLKRVSAVCLSYARRLERIPAPSDPAEYGNVIDSLRRVLPLLRAQAAAMQAVPAPRPLQAHLRTLFVLDRQAISHLERALNAAKRRDAGGVATGLAGYTTVRDRSHALAQTIGIRCNPT